MITVAKENPAIGVKKWLLNWAKQQGSNEFEALRAETMPNGSLAAKTSYSSISLILARKLVHTKVMEKLGLSRCATRCMTGAAPLSREVLEFFGQFGIHIYEVYGMSETSGYSVGSDFGTRSPQCVGHPLIGTELKLEHVPGRDKKGEGEVCFRGRHVMMGYMKAPEKTAETIDGEGWLHSGNV